MSNLLQQEECTGYVHDLLKLIEDDMLVVDSSKRKSCDSVRSRLDEMYQKHLRDEEYATTGNSWNNMKPASRRSCPSTMPFGYEQAVTQERAGPSLGALAAQPIVTGRTSSRIPRRKAD